jgi:hypothetical protein
MMEPPFKPGSDAAERAKRLSPPEQESGTYFAARMGQRLRSVPPQRAAMWVAAGAAALGIAAYMNHASSDAAKMYHKQDPAQRDAWREQVRGEETQKESAAAGRRDRNNIRGAPNGITLQVAAARTSVRHPSTIRLLSDPTAPPPLCRRSAPSGCRPTPTP